MKKIILAIVLVFLSTNYANANGWQKKEMPNSPDFTATYQWGDCTVFVPRGISDSLVVEVKTIHQNEPGKKYYQRLEIKPNKKAVSTFKIDNKPVDYEYDAFYNICREKAKKLPKEVRKFFYDNYGL